MYLGQARRRRLRASESWQSRAGRESCDARPGRLALAGQAAQAAPTVPLYPTPQPHYTPLTPGRANLNPAGARSMCLASEAHWQAARGGYELTNPQGRASTTSS